MIQYEKILNETDFWERRLLVTQLFEHMFQHEAVRMCALRVTPPCVSNE